MLCLCKILPVCKLYLIDIVVYLSYVEHTDLKISTETESSLLNVCVLSGL